MIQEHEEYKNRYGYDEMNHILKNNSKHESISVKIDFLYDGRIRDKHEWRSINAVGKPLPGKQAGQEKERIVFHFYSHDNLEGNKEYKCESKGLTNRPQVSKETAFVPDFYLFLRKNDDEVDEVLHTAGQFCSSKFH
jgi:hypothetical protein